ncbi:MAG: 50S ribosomal protein L13 [Dehalococcoidales bacterium]|nr:50S ribosomal protein L13 [Dehalococcoidales bacterium]
MNTYSVKASDIKREWHVIDATDQVLGHLATEVARLLMGKNKAMFTRNMDTGDFVVIINAGKIRTSGNKTLQKLYYRHSGYPGGFKSVTLDVMLKTKPEWVIEHAVRGMIPHNRLGNSMIKKLKVYAGDSHPHTAQVAAKK